MAVYNVVRMRVKVGRQKEFESISAGLDSYLTGLLRGDLVKTGDSAYCFVGEWDSQKNMADARRAMFEDLDRFRDVLDDLGGGLLTHMVSGEAVVEMSQGAIVDVASQSATAPRAYNIVRLRAKPGHERDLVTQFGGLIPDQQGRAIDGFRKLTLVKIGERTFCILGEWDSYTHLAKARPILIKSLDGGRDLLEDLGGGLGVTYAVSGEVVVEWNGSSGRRG